VGAPGPRRRAPLGGWRLTALDTSAPPDDPGLQRTPLVARVVVDVPLAHLDRPFDYGVPEKFAGTVQAGCRVRVRFHGRLVDGLVWELADTTDFAGTLQPLSHVPSGEPVLTPQVARLARVVADRYAGTVSDVLRLALPPRRSNAEKRPSPTPGALPGPPDPAGFARYPAGPALLTALAEGRPARAVWTALPGEDWPTRLVELCRAALSAARGSLVVVPDGKDLDRVAAAAGRDLPADSFTVLRADDTPEKRYRSFLAASRGAAQVVLGTRAAMFAPVRDLGLVAIWDDGDDLHADERAPYPHARDVLVQRAYLDNCAAVLAGTSRTAEAALLVESGWAHELLADRAVLRAAAPRVQALGDDWEQARDPAARSARLPSLAHDAARRALAAGAPVLVQVPRRGYVPSLACARCRAPARCAHCAGPLGISPRPGPGGARIPACRWCARPAATFDCPHCHATKLRAAVVGESRTAEELARAFPGATVRTSGSTSGVLATVPAGPSLVVATPGAEPVAEGGYGTALLLDSWALLGRADLRAGEETLRRWMNAAALVRPASAGGHVVVAADATHPVVQALVRWDPAWLAVRELADRRELGFPPVTRIASLAGSPSALAEFLAAARLPAHADLLGPVPEPPRAGQEGERERYLVRVPRSEGLALARALTEVQGVRSAKKVPEHVRVQMDPLDLV
jgi:primosomal protein N' (replication factor Y)